MLDNVAYGLKVRGESKQMCAERALHWINTVGLKGYENKYPHQLSGGMRQRVGLARALAADTDIILMDEAFSALDPLIRAEMQDQLLELQRPCTRPSSSSPTTSTKPCALAIALRFSRMAG